MNNWERADLDEIEGTVLQGTVHTSFERLKAVFGESDGPSDDGKIQVQWLLKFDNDDVVTIYDWKSHSPPELIEYWNVGGNSDLAVQLVMQAINEETHGNKVG